MAEIKKPWLGTVDAAEYLGVSAASLHRWRGVNEGPRCYRVGRDMRYDIVDLDAWLEQQKVATARGGVA